MLQVLIVDDESLARKELRAMLQENTDFSVVAEATDVESACECVLKYKPDIIFLDIALRGESGFSILERLTVAPEVVFVTAYDEYALQAFDANALDYLVKPVRRERFDKALHRLRQRIVPASQHDFPQHEERQSIFIQEGKRCYFVRLQDIYLIERVGDYSQIWFGKQHALVSKSLAQLEKDLPQTIFFRANRQEILNCQYIDSAELMERSRLDIVLYDRLSGFSKRVSLSERRSVVFKGQGRL